MMKIRLESLADVDPLRVPLPNGTEVETRIDLADGEGVVPAGAVGRVIESDGGRVRVGLVGGREVACAREHVVPRKAGQLRFAARRHAAWEALGETVVIEAVVGSRAWGLADEGSDTDLRGVFVLPFPWTTALVEPPLDLVSADGSSTYWEVGKATRQAIRADPNTLEALFLPGARATDDLGRWLLDDRDAFVSAEIYGSFGRYALSQLKRLRQSMRLAEHRQLVLEWLRAEPSLSLDAAASRLATATGLESESVSPERAHHRAKQYIKQLYASLFDQGLLTDNSFAALAELAADRGHDFDMPRELRPKNAYNLIRLLVTATGWLREGEPRFEMAGPLRDELLAIKRGQTALADVLARAEDLSTELEDARRHTRLPPRPDVGRIDAALRRIRAEVARRWVEGGAGPWGQGASEPPLAVWE